MNKRHLYWIILLLLLAVPALPAAAQEEDRERPMVGLVEVNRADVRAGPDFAYPVIGVLEHNASVDILGRAGDFFQRWDGRQWIQIRYGNEPAWVYARLLRTSIAFNSLPPTGRILPRDGNGRVPEVFDLSTEVCSQWQGGYTQSAGDFSGGGEIQVTYPLLQGANVYSVIVISPTGQRTAFDSTTNTAVIELDRLPFEEGEYTWRVAPYWASGVARFTWQQVCLLRTGGTFHKHDTRPRRRSG